MPLPRFTIRIYGLLIHDGKILVSDEHLFGNSFTKFPGGGLEFGEGTIEGLKREFREELNLEIDNITHYYTTDFFQESAFHSGVQVISIYYKVGKFDPFQIKTSNLRFDFPKEEGAQNFRWISLSSLAENDLSFPIDKHVIGLLINQESSLR